LTGSTLPGRRDVIHQAPAITRAPAAISDATTRRVPPERAGFCAPAGAAVAVEARAIELSIGGVARAGSAGVAAAGVTAARPGVAIPRAIASISGIACVDALGAAFTRSSK
jgi:hypothetical protein